MLNLIFGDSDLPIGCGCDAVSYLSFKIIFRVEDRFELTPESPLRASALEKIDVGFKRPPAAADEKNFVQERIYRDRLVHAVPETHSLAKVSQVRLDQFGGEDFMMFKRGEAPQLVDGKTRLCVQAGFTPQLVSEPPVMQTVLMAVAASLGVALAPGIALRRAIRH